MKEASIACVFLNGHTYQIIATSIVRGNVTEFNPN